ncbi:hypothetical protein L9F63_002761 [Diploptera punctata]|uniref:Uncharacterized protein n=1 Tax=Diploptera punctata TaxID=6984 RepID=A0AAD7ZRM5_DIPPU|nr:hypothetical protein L9F63_002761 [Diploptera punctata]
MLLAFTESAIIMNCQFSIKHENSLSQSLDGLQDIKVELKSEVEDQIGNVDIKCEIFPGVDPLASEETEVEVEQSEESSENVIENPPMNVTECDSNIYNLGDGKYIGNVKNVAGIFTPSQHSKIEDTDLSSNISDDSNVFFPDVNKPFRCTVCRKAFF